MIDLIVLIACNIANLLLGLSILLRNPRGKVNKAFALLSFSIIFWTTCNFLADTMPTGVDLFCRLTFIGGTLIAFSILKLSEHFPNEGIYTNKLINKLQLSFSIIITGLSLSPWIIASANPGSLGAELIVGPLYFVYIIYIVQALFVMLYNFRIQIKESYSALQRNQIHLILAGLLLYAFFAIGSNLLLPLVVDNWTSSRFGPVFSFFLVGLTAYAIIRHRLFDIRLVVVRTLAYSFSLVTIAVIYSVVAFGLTSSIIDRQNDLLQQFFYLGIAVLLALTFAPLKSFFDRLTRTIFYQDAYQSQKVIDTFSSALVSTVNIDDLGQHAAEILRTAIKSEYIAILLLQKNRGKLAKRRLIVNGENSILKEDDLYNTLLKHTEKLLIRDEMYSENRKIFEAMQNANCAIAARLETHDDFIGYVLFGLKNNGRPYTRQDIDLIRITTDELALGVQNALRFEEIRSFNRTLQEKIEEATSQLRRTNTELRRLDEAKDEFVSMASHQLRTPLTSVKGYLSMVLEGDAGKITAAQRKLLGEAFTSSERMVHLISDFLNVSRLQTGKFMLEQHSVDLSKVVAQEVESLQTTAEAHALKLQYRVPSYFPVLNIDEGKIRQVLMNFIDNAIYYSTEGTSITVALAIEEGNAVLRVHDTGIGVPKTEQGHLFTKFFRATNARKQRPDGTGVGLFLAKKVIIAHGGDMLFESIENEGSTFGFRLPVKKLSASNKANKLDN